MTATQRAAHKAVAQAEAALTQVQERLAHINDACAKRRPGRPPQVTRGLAQVLQAVDAARQEAQRLAGQRATVSQRVRAIGHAYHVVDLERGVRRNGALIAKDIQSHIATMRAVAQHEHLRQACMDRIEQAERGVPKMQATMACVSGSVRQQGQRQEWAPPPSFAMHARLMPSYDLERVAATRTVTQGTPLRERAERLRTPLCAPEGARGAGSPAAQDRLTGQAAKRAEVFQRSRAHGEGRNGDLALRQPQLRGLDHPRQRVCLTAVHHFLLTRADGTTAAERFCWTTLPTDVTMAGNQHSRLRRCHSTHLGECS